MLNPNSLKCIAALILTHCLNLAYGQVDLSLGLKVSVIRSTIMNDDQLISGSEQIESTSLRPKGDIGFAVAISSFLEKELMVGNIYLQPEISYSKTSGVIRYFTEVGNPNETLLKLKETYHNVDIPLVLGYRFLFLRAFAGPVFSTLIAVESELDDLPTIDRPFDDFSIGYRVGIGLNSNRKYLDLYYQQVGNMDRPLTNNGDTFDLKSRQLQVGITFGYFIGF